MIGVLVASRSMLMLVLSGSIIYLFEAQDSEIEEVEICGDEDGWVVRWPSGAHTYGSGYTLEEVVEAEQLGRELSRSARDEGCD